jgi:hypothetical protein
VQCNILSHSRTAAVMTKTACIHWEFTCIGSFFPWQFNFPYLTECDQAPGHYFIKIICKSLNLYIVLQTTAFFLQHYWVFFSSRACSTGLKFEYSYAFLICSIKILFLLLY